VLRIDGEPFALEAESQVTLYRLVQEGLNNVEKHARANRAEIVVDWNERALDVTMGDDGRGFDLGEVPAGHLGLHFMAERASAIGAALDVQSQPGAGTTVKISVPRG